MTPKFFDGIVMLNFGKKNVAKEKFYGTKNIINIFLGNI